MESKDTFWWLDDGRDLARIKRVQKFGVRKKMIMLR